MTDTDIKMALECCGDEEEMHWCTECPYYDKENDLCQEDLHRDALDLINRLEAENERLRKECGNQSELWSNHYESLYQTALGTIKPKAYKECIEKVKALFPSDNEPYQYWEVHEGADNLLKELVGDKL